MKLQHHRCRLSPAPAAVPELGLGKERPMTFWEIREPGGSDYKHVHVSGKLEHPYRLPEVECEKCGASVSSYYDVVLPFECPASFREDGLLKGADTVVSFYSFTKLVKQIAAKLPRGAGSRLKPEACLQPGFLDVPSVPKDDFLWSNLWSGLDSMVVSERVRHVIEDLAPVGIEFFPVAFRRVGSRRSESAPRMPASGEPEDMMQNFKTAKAVPSVPAYFQLLVSAEADCPPGAEPGQVCKLCGEEKNPDWAARDKAWKNLTAGLMASLSKGLDLFRIPQRGTVFVSDRVKTAMEGIGATNVCFRAFPPEPMKVPKRKSKLRL